MAPVPYDDAEFEMSLLERPGADVIPLPQLERLPPSPDRPDFDPAPTPALSSFDSRAVRLEVLELLRSAVELADRIEREAREGASASLARTEEELGARLAAAHERESLVAEGWSTLEQAREDLERARIQVEQERAQAIEAAQDVQALRETAEREAAEAVALANAQATAILEHADAEAEGVASAARQAADEAIAAARREAEELTATARLEAERLMAAAGEAAAAAPPPAPAPPTPDTEPAARRDTGKSDSRKHHDEMSTHAATPQDPEPAFTPPPLSLEDLAAASSLPRFISLNPLRKR